MANRLIIFEDRQYADFSPLTLSRPTFALRCGHFCLWEKIARQFAGYEVSFSCRDDLAPLLRAETGCRVNRIDYQDADRLVFVNGRLCLGEKLADELKTSPTSRVFHQGDVTAGIIIAGPLKNLPSDMARFSGPEGAAAWGSDATLIPGEFQFYGHLWDLVNGNSAEIIRDYQALSKNIDFARMINNAKIDSSARILSNDYLYLAPGAEIGAGAVIDNRRGPVIIDAGAVVGPLSFVEGPCSLGSGARIFRGNIREGCSFGPECRVGGEVEESIFQGYTNKYHDGFIGHAYLGSWVNLGAMTTNSDLKNNYKNIDVMIGGKEIPSGSNKVGSFIGDHTKTGIGTLLNTGISIGFSCNIYGGTLVTSREVPSFSWGDESGYDLYRLDKALAVARVVMSRRNREFTLDDEKLFADIYAMRTGADQPPEI